MFAHRCYMPDEALEGGVFARRLPHTIKPAAWEVSNLLSRCKHLRSLHQPKAKGHRAKRKAKRKQQRAARKGK